MSVSIYQMSLFPTFLRFKQNLTLIDKSNICETKKKASQIMCYNNEQFSSLGIPKMEFILGTSNISVTLLFLLCFLPKGTELAKLTKGLICSYHKG